MSRCLWNILSIWRKLSLTYKARWQTGKLSWNNTSKLQAKRFTRDRESARNTFICVFYICVLTWKQIDEGESSPGSPIQKAGTNWTCLRHSSTSCVHALLPSESTQAHTLPLGALLSQSWKQPTKRIVRISTIPLSVTHTSEHRLWGQQWAHVP